MPLNGKPSAILRPNWARSNGVDQMALPTPISASGTEATTACSSKKVT